MKFVGRKFRKVFVCIAMAVVLMTTTAMTYYATVQAATITTVTIKGTAVRMRSGPGTSYSEVARFNTGATGTWLETVKGTDSGDTHQWHKVTISGKTGYVRDDLATVTSVEVSEDAVFEAHLTAQGFPESYKPALRLLHDKYPEWVFEAQQTGLDWNTVIENESEVGINMVPNSSIVSWKSIADGAYNWKTGTWNVLDSGGWVAASSEIIAHYMDPRNFLNSTSVFQFLKQGYDASSMTNEQKATVKAGLEKMATGTYLAGLCPGTQVQYVDLIVQAAEKNGVSPYMLAASMIQEMGVNGDSRSISGTDTTYPNIFNYYNIGAYKDGNMDAITRGLWFASLTGKYNRPWNTREKAIDGGAQYFAAGYINAGQDTLYLKKFNVQGNNKYSHQYMANVQAADSEAKHTAKAYTEELRNTSLVFKIPVYTNMPESACPIPTGNSDPNYMLSSLSVGGYNLTPTFDYSVTEYDLIVPNNVTSVNITAKAVSSKATISGTGTKSLAVGSNTMKIVVKAQNGNTRVYSIDIVRSSTTGGSVPVITSSKYTVASNTISGVQPGVSVDTFKGNLSAANASIVVNNSNGSANTGIVGTGNVVRVSNGAGATDYTVIIYGDNSGDGVIDVMDMLRIQRYVLGLGKMEGIYATAADGNRDGTIDVMDMLLVQRQVLGLGQIKQ